MNGEGILYLTEGMVVDITSMALRQNDQSPAIVRDYGLLESAVHRPRSSSYGVEHYPGLFRKGAALLHSLARNHVFVDGNERAAWNCTAVFLGVNGAPLRTPVDEQGAERFVLAVTTGALADNSEIASGLRTFHQDGPGL